MLSYGWLESRSNESSQTWYDKWIFKHHVFACFFPLISRPTRITSNTVSLIDNIFTNEPKNCAVSGLLFTDIPDHLPIFSISNECQTSSRKTQWLTFREKNANNVSKFKVKMNYRRWIGRRFVILVIRPVRMILFLENTLIFTITVFLSKRWK